MRATFASNVGIGGEPTGRLRDCCGVGVVELCMDDVAADALRGLHDLPMLRRTAYNENPCAI